MEQINILNQSSSIMLTLVISIFFVIIGLIYSKKYLGLNNYLVATFLLATVFLFPFLVLELFFVFCPLKGRPIL